MVKSRRKVTLKTMLRLTGIQITNQKLKYTNKMIAKILSG